MMLLALVESCGVHLYGIYSKSCIPVLKGLQLLLQFEDQATKQ